MRRRGDRSMWRSRSAASSSSGRRSAYVERAAEVGALDEARARLSRLEVEQAAVPTVVSELVEEVVPPPQRRFRDCDRNWSDYAQVAVQFPLAIPSKVPPRLPIFCRRGPQNGVEELRSPFPPIHKTWKGGCQSNTELRDAIEFGDKKSILALTDLIRQGVLQCHNLPSTVGNMVV